MNEEDRNDDVNPGEMEYAGMQVPAKIESGQIGKPEPQAEGRTEPVLTAAQFRDVAVADALSSAYSNASMLKLSEAETAGITNPFPDEVVEIRPHDGLCYIPHIHISKRLSTVLGIGQWSIIRRKESIMQNVVYAEWVMVIRGCFVGESVGGHPYIPSNPKTNYSDALESTRAEALRRIAGKELLCGSQVWEPEYCRQWVAKYAEQVGGKWRKKAMVNPVAKPVPTPAAKPAVKAADKTLRPEGYAERCKDKFIKVMAPVKVAAWQYAVENHWILPTEKLEDASPSCFPQSAEAMDEVRVGVTRITDNMTQEIMDEYNAAYAQTEEPAAPEPEEKGTAMEELPLDEADAWKRIPIPHWSKHAQEFKTFGDLPKGKLWWWCMQWQPKAWKDRKGNLHSPSSEELALRATLDIVKEKYGFTESMNGEDSE